MSEDPALSADMTDARVCEHDVDGWVIIGLMILASIPVVWVALLAWIAA